MTTENPVQSDDDSDGKKKMSRMTFAERYSILEKMRDMVANGHSLLPAKSWKSLAGIINQLTGLPAYGGLCKEIAVVAGLHEDKLVEKRVSAEEEQQTEMEEMRKRIEVLERTVESLSGMLASYIVDGVGSPAPKSDEYKHHPFNPQP